MLGVMQPPVLEPLSAGELQVRYDRFCKRVFPRGLNKRFVPKAYRPLIPYAELWGIGDDVYREDLIRAAPLIARRDLELIMVRYDKTIYADWLGVPGPREDRRIQEYNAFIYLMMAADLATPVDVDPTPPGAPAGRSRRTRVQDFKDLSGLGLLSGNALEARYRGYFRNLFPQGMDPRHVPRELRSLIPYAAVWGITHRTYQEHVINHAPPVAQRDLARLARHRHMAVWEDWLAAPAAPGKEEEHLAFVQLKRAVDYVIVLFALLREQREVAAVKPGPAEGPADPGTR